MSPEAQNIAICEALGAKYHKPTEEELKCGSYCQYEPDFTRDLDACHHMEKKLKPDSNAGDDRGWETYSYHLSRMVGANDIFHCTAAQRAEAFLRTLGLWVESKEGDK